ncbi:hypothetical protein GJ496_010890 [Pomphorhynchus laevis]|nr:hypothetical protein GJ496_010890 [Pomphorhynchus laevis]
MSRDSSSLSDNSAHEDEDNVNTSLVSNDLIVTKYMMAAEITNRVLAEILDRCVPGASIRDTCIFGDRRLEEETSNVFKKNKLLRKGLAYPTCISLNNYVAFFSPMLCDNDSFMNNGDVVKVELGCHIDGYPALVAHTFVIGADKEKITGRKADVVCAAYQAFQAAIRIIKPGESNKNVSKDLMTIVSSYQCELVDEWASFQIERNRIEGTKSIVNLNSESRKDSQEPFTFDQFEVYGVDIVVSSGEGRTKMTDLRTTVHRKLDAIYPLKIKASRTFLHEVDKRFGNMPFSLRAIDNETNARLGVTECVNHGIMDTYPVLIEKEGEFVARFKTTLLLLASGSRAITGKVPLQLENYESQYSVTDERLKRILDKSLPSSIADKRKRKKKAKHSITNADVE